MDFEKRFKLLNSKPVKHTSIAKVVNDIDFMEVETFVIFDTKASNWKVVQPYFGIKTPTDLAKFL